MKAQALFSLVVYLVHLSASSSDIIKDDHATLADMPRTFISSDLPPDLANQIFMNSGQDLVVEYAGSLEKSFLNSSYNLSRVAEIQLLGLALDRSVSGPFSDSAKYVHAAGVLAVKLCMDRLVDEQVMKGKSREEVYRDLRSLPTHPNLDHIKSQVVLDLLNELCTKFNDLSSSHLSVILLPFARSPLFPKWYDGWPDEAKHKYRDAIMEALLRAGRLKLLLEMNGGQKFSIREAIKYRCLENDWDRLQALLDLIGQVKGINVYGHVIPCAIEAEAINILEHLLVDEDDLFEELCQIYYKGW